MLHGDRPMPVIPAPLGDRRQRSGIASLGCDLPDHVDPFARLAPDMGEAEEVERGAMRSRVLGALRGAVAKFWRLPRVEPAGAICASEPEVADDPERPCREAEAPIQGRFTWARSCQSRVMGS